MELIDQLQAERAASVRFLVTSGGGRTEFDSLAAATDESAAGLDARLKGDAAELDEAGRPEALAAIGRIAEIRQDVNTFGIEQGEAYTAYNEIIDDLFTLNSAIINDISDTELLVEAQTTLAGLLGKEQVWRQTAFIGVRLELGELTGPGLCDVHQPAQRRAECLRFAASGKLDHPVVGRPAGSAQRLKAADELVELHPPVRPGRARCPPWTPPTGGRR